MRALLFLLGCFVFTPSFAMASESVHFAPARLKNDVSRFVTATQPNRSVGQKGHRAAMDYIKAELGLLAKTPGASVRLHSFSPDVEFAASNYRSDFENLVEGKIPTENPDYRKWKSFTETSMQFVRSYREHPGTNLILELKGTTKPKEVIYVGAHFDTITHDHESMRFTPDRSTDGADDNASGVVALLAIAKELAKQPHARTIRFVAFDYEEIFFLGSYALAKDLATGVLDWAPKDERVLGLFNLEMIGWSTKPAPRVVKIYMRKDAAAPADELLGAAFTQATTELKAKIKPVIIKNGFNRSDNWSFWQHNLPSICITQDWESDFDEKHYHTGHDSPQNLNYDYLSDVARVTAGAVKNVVGK